MKRSRRATRSRSSPRKDKGRREGKVIAVLPARRTRSSSRASTASRSTSRVGQTQRGTKTGGIDRPRKRSIHVSNVMLVDPETKKPTRVGYRIET